MYYSHVARKALGRLAFKTQADVIDQWRNFVATHKENREKIRRVLSKIFNRVLAQSFTAWVEWVQDKKIIVSGSVVAVVFADVAGVHLSIGLSISWQSRIAN